MGGVLGFLSCLGGTIEVRFFERCVAQFQVGFRKEGKFRR